MPPKTRRLTSLAASKVIRKRALKTTVKKGQIWQRSRRQVQLRMRATEPNRLLGAREMLALVDRRLAQPPSKRSMHFEDGIGHINTYTIPSRPRPQRVRMIVPEPPMLSSSPYHLKRILMMNRKMAFLYVSAIATRCLNIAPFIA
ncbi:hypothetical protein V8E54_013093 [Elaphomyces granulatus]